MAVSPNTTSYNFCTWVLANHWLGATNPQRALITIVQSAALAGTTVTDNQWNNFLRATGLWYQYYTSFLAQTTTPETLPTGIVQGDLLYGSAANTLSRLAKSATANSFLKNSGTSNNPAWSTISSSVLSDVTAWTDYGGTSTYVGFSSFTFQTIRYYIIGKTMWFIFLISGTSNSTSFTFTLPFNSVSTNPQSRGWCESRDAGTPTNGGLWNVPQSSNVVQVYPSPVNLNWTASGTKFGMGQGFVALA